MEKFRFKKKYGQNFITDKNLINKIVSLVSITKNDLVIEVGPGDGALTTELVKIAKNCLIYEIDSDLEFILKEKLRQFDNFDLIIEDFLDADIYNDIKKYVYEKLVFISNLPYYVTTPIIKKFIDSNVLCDYMIVMVQEEVADRFCAKVGSREYGSLTVFLGTFYDIKKEVKVNRKLFNPIPNVDSAVVVMKKKEKSNVVNYDFYKQFVMDCFKFKRKTLRNNLKNYNLKKIEYILDKYDLNLGVRAEDISVEIFVEIANVLVD